MKTKYATIDLCAAVHDLKKLIGMRVVNVYDINSKTYLIKLQKPNDKAFILFESGIRIHCTSYEWPKSMMPSNFSMKFRKHINQKRLTSVAQVGTDRIVDLQFGSDDRSCHVIVELYDRGNVVLTDQDYTVLNILRPRTDASDHDVRFAVREKYPLEHARHDRFLASLENVRLFLSNSKEGEPLRKALVRNTPYSSLLIDHCLLSAGLTLDAKISNSNAIDAESVLNALRLGESISKEVAEQSCRGYIAYSLTQKKELREAIEAYQEYYPYDFVQFHPEHSDFKVLELATFSEAVDKFYSAIDSQKAQQRVLGVEREAEKKVENIRRDHELRLKGLEDLQAIQERRAEYIEYNRELVEEALVLVRTALANKLTWEEIQVWLEKLAAQGVRAAKQVARLDLQSNKVVLQLSNPYEEGTGPIKVDIDVGLSSDQNARRYFHDRKAAAVKEQRTMQASSKALKSAQQQAKNRIDQAHTKQNFIRPRKLWFEKFRWFISTDGFLVLAGRDSQQNTTLVGKYLRPGDVYVHAEIQGAASVVVRNRNSPVDEIPPKTLNEAGTMAICFSSAWEAKVVVNAWWVRHDQVSRTAQTGEYLPPGSFMIRGKKNFLPTSQLQLGFGLLFKLDDESTERHRELTRRQMEDRATTATFQSENGDESSPIAEEAGDEEPENDDASVGSATEASDSEDGGASSNEGDAFPDVEVNLSSLRLASREAGSDNAGGEYSVINLVPSLSKPAKRTETAKYLEEKETREKEQQKSKSVGANKPISKRQKHKMEKIRRKYKDQDEDEREIRLQLLGHPKKKKPIEEEQLPRQAAMGEKPPYKGANFASQDEVHPDQAPAKDMPGREEGEESDEGEGDDTPMEYRQDESNLIDSLTPAPLTDDSLLFVLPMCGPYSALQRAKFKVKVTPGTGKRGRAVKAALALFTRDKTLSTAEKLLIRSLTSDDSVAQNVPGKIRISAPLLNVMKHK